MIKKLLTCVREYRKETFLAPFLVIFEVILEVLIPFLMAMLLDNGIYLGDIYYIIRMGMVLIICATFSLTFGVLSGRYAAFASAGLAKNIRHDLFDKIQNFSFANMDKFSTASLISRMTTDISNVQMSYQMIIRVLVRAPIMLILSFIMVLTISTKIAMIFLVTGPLLILALYLIIKYVHPIFIRAFKRYDQLNRVVQENLHGIRVVKSFVREDFETNKFKAVSHEIYHDFVKAEKILALNMPIMQFSVYACILLISWFGAQLVVSHSMTTGELVSIFAYTTQILMSLIMLSNVLVMIIISKPSLERIVEVLDEEVDLTNQKNPIHEVQNGSIIFENVNFSYVKDEEKTSLSQINLKIAAGETVGIIGGTGSGKTTLVQLIPRLYDITSGSIKVGGVNVRDYEIETLRNEVAMVLQKNILFSGTIKENLRWGNKEATEEQLKRVCELAQADSFIQTFPDGYDTYIEQGGSNVSGGQKQRLCIARALLKKPKVLILDDSTSAVDTKTDSLIRQAFLEEIPDTTKIIIAQRITSIEAADKIIVMDEGKIKAIGTHKELLNSNLIYREVYESQQRGGEMDV